jgi:rhamnulokinase
MAAEAEPFRTLIDPGHAPFASPDDVPAKIAAFAQGTSQPAPKTPGQFVRCCLESLALAYRKTKQDIEGLLDRQTDVLHIVGGGGRNELLDQMTADAMGIPVIVGPYEGTAMGNALTQAIGAGQVKDLAHLRQIVRANTELKRFEPRDAAAFDAQWDRYTQLLGK